MSAINDTKNYGAAWKPNLPIAPCLRNASWTTITAGYGYSGIHRNPLWVLDYSRSPGLKMKVGFRKAPWHDRNIREGHLYPPNTVYWEDWGRDKNRILMGGYILFTGGTAAGLRKLVHPRWKYAKIIDPHGRIEALIHAMAMKGNGQEEKNFWDAQADFCRLVAVLNSAVKGEAERWHIPPEAEEADESEAGLVERVNAYFRENLSGKLSLEKAAGQLHVSPATLSCRYRQLAGTSPMAALASMRIEEAKALLLKGERIYEVAARLGFCDAFHLSKVFKRKIGLSPRDFLANAAQPGKMRYKN